MLSVNDIKGLYAITPTPSKPGAERWDATDLWTWTNWRA